MEMRRLAPLGDLVSRIAALEDALRTGKPPAEIKSTQTSAPVAATAKTEREVSAKSISGEQRPNTESTSRPAGDVAFLEQLKSKLEQNRRRLLIAAIEGALKAHLEGDEFLIEFAPEAKHYRDTLARTENAKALRETCAEVCGREIGIRFSINDGADAPQSV